MSDAVIILLTIAGNLAVGLAVIVGAVRWRRADAQRAPDEEAAIMRARKRLRQGVW